MVFHKVFNGVIEIPRNFNSMNHVYHAQKYDTNFIKSMVNGIPADRLKRLKPTEQKCYLQIRTDRVCVHLRESERIFSTCIYYTLYLVICVQYYN